MQPQQVTSQATSQQTAQIQVVSSLSQSQQRNIQAVVQKQQQQAKATTVAASPTTSKSAQVGIQSLCVRLVEFLKIGLNITSALNYFFSNLV